MEKEKPMIMNSMKTGIFIFTIAVLLVILMGCSSKPQRIEISASPIEKPKLVLPEAAQLRLKDLEWIIITEENAEQVFADLQKGKKDPILIGLTDDGYETLSLNMSDIMALIQQQRAIIAAYKGYYEESEQALENANKQIDDAKKTVDEQQQVKPKAFYEFWK